MKATIFWIALVLFNPMIAGAWSEAGEEDEVKRTLLQMWEAVEQGDLEGYTRFLHPDYTAFGENDAYLLEGREQESRGMKSYLERARGVHTEMHQPVVRVEGNVAWIIYYWTDEGEVDGKRVTSSGKSTRIFVRQEGKWLCIHGHFTSVDR